MLAILGLDSIVDSSLYGYALLPAFIFLCRITDVSIGTIRIIFVSRGYKFLAALLGFVEVLIWLAAISQIMQNLSNVVCYISYAGGYATGNYLGVYLEGKLSIGQIIVRIVTKREADELASYLRANNFGVTVLDAKGSRGNVKVIFMIIARADLPRVAGIIKRFNPKAFYSVEDVRFVSEGIGPKGKRKLDTLLFKLVRPFRKGK